MTEKPLEAGQLDDEAFELEDDEDDDEGGSLLNSDEEGYGAAIREFMGSDEDSDEEDMEDYDEDEDMEGYDSTPSESSEIDRD